jgi:signal transduction histidine kinase
VLAQALQQLPHLKTLDIRCALAAARLAHLPDGVWVCDLQSHTLHRNPAAVAIWAGVRDADVSRFPGCLGWWADTGRPIGDDEWGTTRALKAGETVLDERVEIETTEGVRKVLLTSYIPLKGVGGASPRCLVLIKDITALHRTERRLHGAEMSLRALSQRLLQVQEDERQRIAQELHDDIGQVVAAMRMHLAHMVEVALDATMTGMATDVLQMSDQLGARVRQIGLGLRPLELDDFGVMAALRSLVVSLGRLPALKVRLRAEGREWRYPSAVETAAFRIAQEALSNAMQHSACSVVDILVSMAPGLLQLTITDDGVGFEPELAQVAALRDGHIGLAGMQERARLADGTCELRSKTGQGTTVQAVFRAVVEAQ